MARSTRFDFPHGPQLPPLLGEVIRARREALGFTQETLAERCDLDQMQIGRIERGTTNPTVKCLGLLALGLGTHIDVLLYEARLALVRLNPWYPDAVSRGRVGD